MNHPSQPVAFRAIVELVKRPLVPLAAAHFLGFGLVAVMEPDSTTRWHDVATALYFFAALLPAMTWAARRIARRGLKWFGPRAQNPEAESASRNSLAVPIIILLSLALLGAARQCERFAEQQRAQATLDALDDARPRALRGTVVSLPDSTASGSQWLLLRDVEWANTQGEGRIPGRVRLLVREARTGAWPGQWWSAPPDAVPSARKRLVASLMPGERIEVAATIAPVRDLGNFDVGLRESRLANQRIFAEARSTADSPVARIPLADSAPGRIKSLAIAAYTHVVVARRGVAESLRRALPESVAPLAICILFNDMQQLSDAESRAFRDSGTLHFFAVSGAHIAVLAFLLQLLFRSLGLPSRTAHAVSFLLLFGYVAAIDFVAPATRALLMYAGFVAARMTHRETDAPTILTFAVALIVAYDPALLFQPGLQLSIAGVLGIVVISPVFRQWLPEMHREQSRTRRAGLWLTDIIVITISVAIMLFPLTIYYFQQYNLMSVPANFVVGILAVPALAGTIATALADTVHSGTARVIGAATGTTLDAVRATAFWAASFDFTMLRLARPPLAVVALAYAIMFSGPYFARRDRPDYRPKSTARLLIHSLAATLIILAASLFRAHPGTLRITFLDVGQGDSTLVEFPTGETLLVDAGLPAPNMGRYVVAPQIRALGLRAVTTAVATHADADHIGGLSSLLTDNLIGNLAVGPTARADAQRDTLMNDILTLADAQSISPITLSAGHNVTLGGVTVETLNPPDTHETSDTALASDNDRSLVFRITYGNFSALLMGDAEASAERRILPAIATPVDVLKLGHHGSRSSSTPEFLAAARPAVAIASCGWRNRYQHPHPRVVDNVQSVGARLYRTDHHGAVRVESDGETYTVRTVRVSRP